MSLAGRFPYSRSILAASTLALASLVTPVAAQWAPRALADPIVRTISVSSNVPAPGSNTLQVATLGGGYFQGVDNGSTITWTRFNNGLPSTRLLAMRALSQTSIFVATDTEGVYVTSDGGANWTASNGSGATSLACRNARALTIPGGATSTVYVGTECEKWSGVYKSSDGGASWTRVGTGVIPDDAEVNSIQSNNTGTLLYVATDNYGIFKSTNSGITWTTANSGIATPNPRTLNVQFIGSTTSGLLAYVLGEGVYKSTDSGVSWTLSSTGLPAGSAALAGIQKDGLTNTTFYIGIDGAGIYRSTDSGASWALWGGSAGQVETRFARIVATDPANAGKYYIGSLNGLMATTDNGATFTDLNSGMGSGRVNSILHDSGNQNIAYFVGVTIGRASNFYATIYDNTVVTRLDAGITGTTSDGFLIQHPANPSVMYVTTNHKGVFKTTDQGTTWNAINAGLPSMIGQAGPIAMDPTNPQALYLGSSNDIGIYKSLDGGATWATSSTGLATARSKAVHWISIHPTTPTLLYAAADDGLYKSVDGGANWTVAYTALDSDGTLLPVRRVRFNPANSSEVYIGTDHRDANGTIRASSGVLKTVNAGANWTQVLGTKRVRTLDILPNGYLIAGLAEAAGQPALQQSIDGGATWTAISTGLTGSQVKAVGVHPTRNLYLTLSLEDGFYVTETPLLTISRAGTGSGSVTSSPTGIDCGADCSARFPLGQSVTLTATPAGGSHFAGWSGGGCTGTGTCTVTMDRARGPTATFNLGVPATFALTVSKTGAGSGTVTSSPAGISCGTTCSASFSSGTAVTLTATPGAGSIFSGWSDGGCSGSGTCTVTMNAATTVTGTFALATSVPRLVNISTRGRVLTGDNVMIGGFIISGATPKKVLITARGPSLAAFGVTGAMANPSMQLFAGQTVIAANDDWVTAPNVPEIQATGIAPSSALESAILMTLNPGPYTAIVSGVGGGTGVGIVEVFEMDHPEIPLINISTRGQVQTGDNVMIGGFIIQGDAPKTVLITARGPSLTAFGVPGALANPVLQIFSGQTAIASNDDWETNANVDAIRATGVAPGDSREAALLLTLNPGAYTAIVSGAGGTTGVGIVEVFAQ